MRPHARKINILFTSAGRRYELLRAFRSAYVRLSLGGTIVAIDANPLAPSLKIATEAYIVPRVEDPAYLSTLLTICRRHEIDLIFPLTDPEIPFLACHRKAFEEIGARPVVVNAEAAAICGDKWLTQEFFARLGLATACSWLPGQTPPDAARYPFFIKPRDGSGAAHCFQVRNPQELELFSNYVPNPMISETLPGPEVTSDVVCDLDGALLGVVSRSRIEVRAGEVSKGVTIYDRRIADACALIAGALPAVGPITVQCMMKEGVPHFTEINARFGGGAPLGIAAGADFPAWLLGRAAGLDIPIPPPGTYERGVYMTRFDGSLFYTEAERARLAGRRI